MFVFVYIPQYLTTPDVYLIKRIIVYPIKHCAISIAINFKRIYVFLHRISLTLRPKVIGKSKAKPYYQYLIVYCHAQR